jgi:hypothetical protein
LKTTPSPEVRRRIHTLLEALDKKKDVRALLPYRRTIEVLEHMGTREARSLLEEIVLGAPQPSLLEDATASLARLKKRPLAKP